jgi:hypothetical protein
VRLVRTVLLSHLCDIEFYRYRLEIGRLFMELIQETDADDGRHEPVLPGGTEIARAGHLNPRAAAIAAGVLAVGAAFR